MGVTGRLPGSQRRRLPVPTPAEGGNPAPARRMVPLYPGATTTTARPPLPVDSREQLVYLLTQASELEQGILCEYLFALYSLKRDPDDGLDPDQLAQVTRWGRTLSEIAVQEMLHLTLATNLLIAVGAAPHLHRPNFPIRCAWYPPDVQIALVPFGEAALRHFLYLARPAARRPAGCSAGGSWSRSPTWTRPGPPSPPSSSRARAPTATGARPTSAASPPSWRSTWSRPRPTRASSRPGPPGPPTCAARPTSR